MLRPKHMFPSLATPGDITRNIVSATMFPSLARPQKNLTGFNLQRLKCCKVSQRMVTDFLDPVSFEMSEKINRDTSNLDTIIAG